MPKISMSISQDTLAKLGIDHRKAASILKEQILKLSETIGKISYNENVLIKLSMKLYNDTSSLEQKIMDKGISEITVIDFAQVISDIEILYEMIKGQAITPIEENILKYIEHQIKNIRNILDNKYKLLIGIEHLKAKYRKNKKHEKSILAIEDSIKQDILLEILKLSTLILAYVTGLVQLLTIIREGLKTTNQELFKLLNNLNEKLEERSNQKEDVINDIYT